MAQNYSELRKDNVRDAIYEDLQNNCEVLRTSWSGNAFPANPKVGQPCYRVDEDKLYYWDGYKWSQKGGGGSAELKTMELAAATSERVSITLEGARCLDKNMMFVFVDKIAQDPSTYSMNDDGTVVNFTPAIPANAAVTLRWFDTDVGTFDTAIFASDAEFAAGELTNKAPNVKQVHSLSDQIQTSNANYVKSELQSNLLNYTTNRILEIPQDIKLELNDGTLTLKAGSKVYVPNGFEADGTTPKFDVENITSDITVTSSYSSVPRFLTRIDTGWDVSPVSAFYSGSSAPTGSAILWWYDTENNLIKMTRDSGSTWTSGYPLPLAIVHTDGTQIVSIDKIFNGFGYIGSTVFALPGVKVQIPNGKNEDGTCKTSIFTKTNVVAQTFTASGDFWFDVFVAESQTYCLRDFGKLHYDSEENLNIDTAGNSRFVIGQVHFQGGKCVGILQKTVDSVANSNASNFSQAGRSYLSGLGMPSKLGTKLTTLASGSNYTAPENGWFYVIASPNSGTWMILGNVNTGLGMNSSNSSGGAVEEKLFVPALKGQTIIYRYEGTFYEDVNDIYFTKTSGEN